MADIPYFWLDGPKGRSNPNDPKSPINIPSLPIAPAYTSTPIPVPTNTISPTPTITPTFTWSPTDTPGTPPTPVGTATTTPYPYTSPHTIWKDGSVGTFCGNPVTISTQPAYTGLYKSITMTGFSMLDGSTKYLLLFVNGLGTQYQQWFYAPSTICNLSNYSQLSMNIYLTQTPANYFYIIISLGTPGTAGGGQPQVSYQVPVASLSTTSWNRVTIPFASFGGFDPNEPVSYIEFSVTTNINASNMLMIDNIKFE